MRWLSKSSRPRCVASRAAAAMCITGVQRLSNLQCGLFECERAEWSVTLHQRLLVAKWAASEKGIIQLLQAWRCARRSSAPLSLHQTRRGTRVLCKVAVVECFWLARHQTSDGICMRYERVCSRGVLKHAESMQNRVLVVSSMFLCESQRLPFPSVAPLPNPGSAHSAAATLPCVAVQRISEGAQHQRLGPHGAALIETSRRLHQRAHHAPDGPCAPGIASVPAGGHPVSTTV